MYLQSFFPTYIKFEDFLLSLVQSCFGVGLLPKCLFDFFERYWSLIENGVSSIDLSRKSKNIISKIMLSFLLSYISLFNGYGNRLKMKECYFSMNGH